MALHCSKNAGSQKALEILESAILTIAEISENERDKLIKKHMVVILPLILMEKFMSGSCLSMLTNLIHVLYGILINKVDVVSFLIPLFIYLCFLYRSSASLSPKNVFLTP